MFGYLIDIMQTATGKKISKMKNNVEYMNWFNLLERYAQYRYEFEGLPDTINERVLKQALIWYGSCAFFDKDDALFCLPARATQDFNVYGDPCYAWVYGRNGYNEQIGLYIKGQDDTKFITKGVSGQYHTKGKGVFVRENYNFYPFINYVFAYAMKLSDTARTIDTERFHLKRPYIITAKEEVVPTVKKFMEKTGDNEEYIVSTGIFDANDVNALPISLPTGALKDTEELQDWYLNQFLTLCGLNNNQDANKKERLIVDEVNANNESIDTNIQPMIEYLQEQLDEVNKIYSTDITVKAMKEEFDDEDILGTDSGEDKSSSVSGDKRSE
jgi:hypothetical protein